MNQAGRIEAGRIVGEDDGVQGHDPSSLAAAFAEAHYDEVYRYCARRLPCREDAQDAAQEVFLRLVRGQALYERRGKPLAYLYTCARNVCADFHRRRVPDACVLGDEAERIADPASVGDMERLAMDDALARLRPEEREVLELRYGQDLTMAQAADVTGRSRFALYRIERKALSALRQQLGGE